MTIDDDDIRAISDAVRKFAELELAPNSQRWDAEKHFPVDVLRRAGRLGLGGIYVSEESGGVGLGRATAVRVFSAKQLGMVRDYVDEGKEQPGVPVVLDGTTLESPSEGGFYQGPTILAGVDNSWRIAREEVFGPVLVAIPWTDVDEVVDMANDSHYGLAAYIWSQDLDEALATAHRVESGWVQVNQGGGQVVGQAYGGYKASGIGREFSLEGALEGFTQTKQINVRIGRLTSSGGRIAAGARASLMRRCTAAPVRTEQFRIMDALRSTGRRDPCRSTQQWQGTRERRLRWNP